MGQTPLLKYIMLYNPDYSGGFIGTFFIYLAYGAIISTLAYFLGRCLTAGAKGLLYVVGFKLSASAYYIIFWSIFFCVNNHYGMVVLSSYQKRSKRNIWFKR